jgi:aminoglycoside phosphotransferase (APT) family kinase protein
VVCEQRDFAPWNLLVGRDDDLAVLDWESSEPRGIPALDLIYFLTYLGIHLDGAHATGRYAESYLATLTPSTPLGELAAECLELYGRKTGVPADDLHALRTLTWMLHSRSAYRQLAGEAAGPPSPQRLRRALFARLWEAEVRHGRRG